ncbi:MAG: hypothetical protein Q4B88_04705 [Moraxella sp.]|nr:hypothetical protein [Moraxella sp.]
MPALYRLKISLATPRHAITTLHRVLEISDNARFADVYERLVTAFNQSPTPLYQFFISRSKIDDLSLLKTHSTDMVVLPELLTDIQALYPKAVLHPAEVTLATLALAEKTYFYAWQPALENTEERLYRIRVEKILPLKTPPKEGQYAAALTKSVGEFPQTTSETTAPETDIEFEMGLVAALMLIATSDYTREPVRWQNLVAEGIADELVKRNLIKPCVSPTHKVRLTPFGESELVHFMQLTSLGN